jgi:hypothetical protein
MPKIQTKAQRRGLYEIIAKAEGEQCLVHKIEKGIRVGPPRRRLVIEHSDNNEKNWAWGNIHLACYSCNKKLEKLNVHDKISLLRSYSDQLEREREREGLPTWKTVLRDAIPYEDGSPEMQARRRYEPRWERYALKKIKENGSILRKDLIAGGAKYSGCATNTSINYLIRHTGPEGPLKEDYDDDGNKIIRFLENPRLNIVRMFSDNGKPKKGNNKKS